MTSALKHRLYSSTIPTRRHTVARRWAVTDSIRCPSLHYHHLTAQRRGLADVRDDRIGRDVFFTGTGPLAGPPDCADGKKPPDERTLKLGKTVQILHERLPTLLASPLPQEILSPHISLHLFPSTHPHLPTVSGRIAYLAALWTAPVAWGRVPVIGNVKLNIESERMVKNCAASSFGHEKLIVRWKTCGKDSRGMGGFYRGFGGSGEQVDKVTQFLRDDGEFCGLFIFEFDEEGRIATHTIEHAQESGNWEKMTRVVSVTDWLIGLAKGRNGEANPGYALGYCETTNERHSRRRHDGNMGRR